MFNLSRHEFRVTDTGDPDLQLTWTWRGRVWWHRHDGTVWHAPLAGQGTEWDASVSMHGITRSRYRLDLDGARSHREFTERIVAYLEQRHRAYITV